MSDFNPNTSTITQLPLAEAGQVTDVAVVAMDGEDGVTVRVPVAMLREAIGAADTLTGDVEGNGVGEIATTIVNRAVTFAKLRAIPSQRVLGRGSLGNGDVEMLLLGPGLSLVDGVLDASAPAAASPSATLYTQRTFYGF